MSQEQNNNNQKKMDTEAEQELSSEELDELLNGINEDNYWKKCFDQLDRMKIGQDKYRKIDINKFNKKHLKNGKEIDKLQLYKESFKASLYYYSDLTNYLRLAEIDNSDALLKYKYYQKKYRQIQTYIENAEEFDKKKPSWESYCNWDNKRKEKKKELKPKKNN